MDRWSNDLCSIMTLILTFHPLNIKRIYNNNTYTHLFTRHMNYRCAHTSSSSVIYFVIHYNRRFIILYWAIIYIRIYIYRHCCIMVRRRPGVHVSFRNRIPTRSLLSVFFFLLLLFGRDCRSSGLSGKDAGADVAARKEN